jgi:hypothetical protein
MEVSINRRIFSATARKAKSELSFLQVTYTQKMCYCPDLTTFQVKLLIQLPVVKYIFSARI